MTTPVSAWFKRDASPPTSGVSPTRTGGLAGAMTTHVSGDHTRDPQPWSGDHARQCVVQTGRKSSNLGRQPDPRWQSC